jgi:membrane peptidoglycan carboxypeptidase
LVRCEQAVAARLDVLRVSQVALGTWRMHVMHMEMLREGKMTPQQAEAAWLQSWHQGQQEVTRYRAAVRAARGPRC